MYLKHQFILMKSVRLQLLTVLYAAHRETGLCAICKIKREEEGESERLAQASQYLIKKTYTLL